MGSRGGGIHRQSRRREDTFIRAGQELLLRAVVHMSMERLVALGPCWARKGGGHMVANIEIPKVKADVEGLNLEKQCLLPVIGSALGGDDKPGPIDIISTNHLHFSVNAAPAVHLSSIIIDTCLLPRSSGAPTILGFGGKRDILRSFHWQPGQGGVLLPPRVLPPVVLRTMSIEVGHWSCSFQECLALPQSSSGFWLPLCFELERWENRGEIIE